MTNEREVFVNDDNDDDDDDDGGGGGGGGHGGGDGGGGGGRCSLGERSVSLLTAPSCCQRHAA